MTDITPPPELVKQWAKIQPAEQVVADHWHHIATCAAQWGADQELEACCEWVAEESPVAATELRAARRTRSPSLKEQALMALEDGDIGPGASLTPVEVCIIRRALEQLPE